MFISLADNILHDAIKIVIYIQIVLTCMFFIPFLIISPHFLYIPNVQHDSFSRIDHGKIGGLDREGSRFPMSNL